MIEFIAKYWLQTLFGLIVAALGSWCKSLHSNLKKKEKEQEAIKIAILAILHDRLFQGCNYYLKQGFIPIDEAENIMDNLKLIYEAYHELGGNGTGTHLYNRFLELPIRGGFLHEYSKLD